MSSFATSIWPLFVTFGLIFGFGVNLVITGSMSVVTSHFDSNNSALPTTLPGVGSAIGKCPSLSLSSASGSVQSWYLQIASAPNIKYCF